ncbi:MAG: yceI 1 [Rickettsiales bacterium]|nr:yceI 1 [Rickettsiales bacterium]
MKQSLYGIMASTVITLASSSAFAAPETYNFDPMHTNITWHANHFGFSNPSGKFAQSEGTLILDEEKPENSKVNVTIKPASVFTGIEKFDTHLKSKDFFDVEKFPSATFVSDKVEVTGKDAAKVHGTLTLLGIAKPTVLDVKLNKIGDNMNKVKTAGFSATTVIKRSDFGMNYAIPGVSDDVKLDIEVEANRK